jgi:hypothetical protein
MTAEERKALEAAMKRVGNEITNYQKGTGTLFREQFIEDLRLILFETWVLSRKKK